MPFIRRLADLDVTSRGSAYYEAFNKDALTRMMNNKWTTGGGSFWFEYNER